MNKFALQRRIEEFKSILSVTTLKMVTPLYLVFIIVDYLYIPQHFELFIYMRVFVVLITCLIYSKSRFISSIRDAETLTILLAAITAFPITCMIWISGDIASPYYAGLNLAAVGGIAFMPRTLKNLIVVIFVIYGPFIISTPFFSYTDSKLVILILNILFIISTALVAFMVNYYNNLLRNKETAILLELENKIEEIQNKQNQIDEKNKSLIKIGELAAQVAHDIRSPATALEAVAQMFSAEIDPRQKRLIQNAAKRINDIANHLVVEYREKLTRDLSAVSIDRNIDLNSLIEDVAQEKRLSLDPKHRILIKAPESISVPHKLSPIEFQRVLSNLLNNSIEALDKANGQIDVELYRKDNRICLTVRDNGKGIPSDHIPKIFEKGVSGKAQGAGLGLAHAKQYLESIDGSINVESIPSKETKVSILI